MVGIAGFSLFRVVVNCGWIVEVVVSLRRVLELERGGWDGGFLGGFECIFRPIIFGSLWIEVVTEVGLEVVLVEL